MHCIEPNTSKTRQRDTQRVLRRRAGAPNGALGVVLQTLDSLLLRLRDRSLPDEPRVRELRQSIEKHAQRMIESFVDASSTDPAVLAESIAAYHHLANLSFTCGRIEECSHYMSSAFRLCERLIVYDPSSSDYAEHLAQCHHKLGI